MWLRAALGLALLLLAAGCGSAPESVPTTSARTVAQAPKSPAPFHVGVVGALSLGVPGVVAQHGTLAEVSGAPLVLVSAQAVDLPTVAAAARANPHTHFAYVGASTKGSRLPNLLGVVLRDDQAAQLAGVVAGLVAADQGGVAPRVAWVGPEERALAGAFSRGAHASFARTVVLRQWSRSEPARCKEAALTAIGRGAVLVAANGGMCADAAVAAAHEQNLPALRLDDFELPSVAAEFVARDALGGVFRGHEDLIFGAASGAIGIRTLDPRIPVATAVRARAAAQQLASGLPVAG